MKKSKILVLVMIMVLSISCFVGCGDDKGDDSEDLENQGNNKSAFSNVAVGEYIKFGKYEQDNDESTGKEDIEWLVLDKQDDKILVVSKYALDSKAYNENSEDITWEDCTLRIWLNNDFMDNAFSEDEKAKIPTVTIVNDDNPEGNIDGGNDTQDKVFLLSMDEVYKYFDSDEERVCFVTDYAKELVGSAFFQDTENEKAKCFWWLRSPGNDQYDAAAVIYNGSVNDWGYVVYDNRYTVRPALWINIK